ncbi:MAG: PadR family transcriptional regulator [Microthrixaceae bacterium]
MASLSPTSYAILGLLSLRSWTTYELTEQMRRALGRFWPRAESGIYTEPKKLVAAGYATVDTEYVGQRQRQRYTITAAGRRAVREWIPTPGAPPQVEFEQLVKVFFAELGTRADLLRTLRTIKEENEDRSAAVQNIPHEYLENRGDYPQRLPWILITGQFIVEWEQLIDRWSTWAIDLVEQWPDDITQAEPSWETLEQMAERADGFAARIAARKAAARSG